MIYVITHDYSLTRFLFTGLDGVEAILIPILPKRVPFFVRCIKYIARKIGLLYGIMGMQKNLEKKIKKIKDKDVIFYIGETPSTCYILSKSCNKCKRKIAFFWNSCTTIKNCEEKIKKMRKLNFVVASFDKKDAQKYNLIFINQFYRIQDNFKNLGEPQIDNDFFFCGMDKGRKDVLQKMQKLLSSLGHCKFIIPDVNDAVPYLDYLELLKKSRVLCDVTQKNQSGLTLRILESLFFSKKIITNNESVKEYDFYAPNNILIYTSHTTREDVQSFLMKPYEKVDDNILARYEVTNVLNSIVKAF